eukprot:scaffold17649_cov40-Cyclotella_meneghiniana.AAC.3
MGSNPGINLSLFFLAPASPDLRTVSHSHQPWYGAPTAANMSHPPLISKCTNNKYVGGTRNTSPSCGIVLALDLVVVVFFFYDGSFFSLHGDKTLTINTSTPLSCHCRMAALFAALSSSQRYKWKIKQHKRSVKSSHHRGNGSLLSDRGNGSPLCNSLIL